MPKGHWPGRRNWTPAELLELQELLSHGLTDDRIAHSLGRTALAIRLARKRHGIVGRRQLFLTTRGVAKAIGVRCSKTVAKWIRRGWLRARKGQQVGPHHEYYVAREALYDFLQDRRYWHVWRPDRIEDPEIKDWAAERRLERYLRPGEVAARLCVHQHAVNQWIHKGLLPAYRWGNWWLKESDVEAFRLPCERSRKGMIERRWTPQERLRLWAFRNAGCSWKQIGEALGRSVGSVSSAWRRFYKTESPESPESSESPESQVLDRVPPLPQPVD